MRYILPAILSAFFIACTDSPTQSSSDYDSSKIVVEKDSKYKDFIRVKSSGHYTTVGTNNGKVGPKEGPAMRVEFEYDFSMASHEITQEEYYSLMDGKPCDGCKKKPIADITFGDVVLYANAKSKKDDLDTVYEYSDVIYDENNHVSSLENFSFHPQRLGYRLPTEAEWIFVAARNWKPENSWNNQNSDYEAHDVCTAEKDDELFCDLAGNVAEWVNDWAGKFQDTTITNFVGAPDGGSQAERVIKGGSFQNIPASMHLYTRGDVYTIISNSRKDYIGARLVIGAIKEPTWMDGNGLASSSTIKAKTSLSTVKKLLGTTRAKIAFTNGMTDNLVYMNYNDGLFSFHEIQDEMPAFHPDISPDGEWVAFCTVREGIPSNSSLYVRRLNRLGTDLVKLDAEAAAIPRFRVIPEGDTVIVYVSTAKDNNSSSFLTNTSTWQVPFSNGAFGTPVKLFDGAYHGGISPDQRLAVSGASRLKVRYASDSAETVFDDAAIDSVWYNGEQACNASLSQDGTNRTLFLDFKGKTGTKFVGSNYQIHERILIADSTGELIQSIGAPEGYTFDYTEWAGNKNLIVAALTDGINATHPLIVAVNVKDSSVTELVEGDDLMYPALWVQSIDLTKEESSLDLDSLGAYMTTSSDITTRIMKVKMDYFWKYRESAEVAIIGSSRSFSGVDPTEIESYFTVNLAYAAQDMASTDYFVQNYFLKLMPKLKAIIITLDYDRWYVTDKNWKDWFGNIPGYKYDEHHSFWKDGVPKRMYELTQNALNPNEEEYSVYAYHNGLYHSTTEGISGESPSIDNDLHWFDSKQSAYKYNLSKVKNILDSAKAAGILVIGAIFPQSPYYVKTHSAWGRYGLTLKDAAKIESAVNELTKEYDNFIIFDEYKNGENDFQEEDFSNDDHLGLKGAVKVAKHIDSLLVANKDKLPEN